MNTTDLARDNLNHPNTRKAFRATRLLVGTYAAICVATVVAIVLLSKNASLVNDQVWGRGVIVAASSLLTLAFAARAARGSRRGFLRLRIISAIQVLAIAVIIALPGAFPLWMKIEQGVCAVLLLGVVALVNGRHLRSLFAGK